MALSAYPARYRHYKGGEYWVHGVALEEATLEPVVVYTPDGPLPDFMKGHGATMWTRPLDDFNALVDGTEVEIGGPEKEPRFELIP